MISNIIMKAFDNIVEGKQNIAYTYCCDDLTFPGDFAPREVIQLVKRELWEIGLFLNDKKTILVRNGQKNMVTGVMESESASAEWTWKFQH